MRDSPVRLESNGDYWKAAWTNSHGRIVSESIGSKKKVSKREALQMCRELAAKHLVTPSLRNPQPTPTLTAWAQRYDEIRTNISEATKYLHGKTLEYLKAFFGDDFRLSRITKAGATDWRAWLAKPNGAEKDEPNREGATKPGLTEQTVCSHVRNAKVIFGYAMRDDLLALNPFSHLVGTPPDPDKTWRQLTEDDVRKLIDAAPSQEWKALIGLCSWAGLRRSEALALTWNDIQWERNRLIVQNTTGRTSTKKRTRACLLTEDLAKMLLDVREATNSTRPALVPPNNMYRNMVAIIRRAGFEPWADPFHTLRKFRATSWRRIYPEHVIDSWLGHGHEVSRKHYTSVEERYFMGKSLTEELAEAKAALEMAQEQIKKLKAGGTGSEVPQNSPKTDRGDESRQDVESQGTANKAVAV